MGSWNCGGERKWPHQQKDASLSIEEREDTLWSICRIYMYIGYHQSDDKSINTDSLFTAKLKKEYSLLFISLRSKGLHLVSLPSISWEPSDLILEVHSYIPRGYLAHNLRDTLHGKNWRLDFIHRDIDLYSGAWSQDSDSLHIQETLQGRRWEGVEEGHSRYIIRENNFHLPL